MTNKGFALLEVLVALLIISIALGSLIETNIAVIRNVDLFEKKSEAIWIAENIANELQLGLITLPSNLSGINGKTRMLNDDWYWEAHFGVSEDKASLKTTIDIKPNEEGKTVLQFITYLAPTV